MFDAWIYFSVTLTYKPRLDIPMTRRPSARALSRAEQAFLDVLPPAVHPLVVAEPSEAFVVAGHPLRVAWVGEGRLGDVKRLLAREARPDVVAGRHLSPGARDTLTRAGVSWVDETGAAEVALGTILVSREGRTAPADEQPPRWAPSTLAVAEALLCGAEATVSATREATGLSTGSCTNALRALTELGLLEADAARGRAAGRRVHDPSALLGAYADAAAALRPAEQLQVGVMWRDPVAGLADLGRRWTEAGEDWCATGAVAAAVVAPLLTNVGGAEVYVGADTLAGLAAIAERSGLKPIEGGRLTLRPAPSRGVLRFATEAGGLRVAPWPRIYADLRTLGVRGEEAAEHLMEVIDGRRS